jgi:hypothetical protein
MAHGLPELAAAIKYAISFKNPDGSPVVDVITCSMGSGAYGAGIPASSGLLEALQLAESEGVVFTQAMENNKSAYPAGTWIWGVESVVTVGGTSATRGVWTSGDPAWGTAYGPDVDIAARATQNFGIINTQIGSGGTTSADAKGMTARGRWSHAIWGHTGNSFATPHVAGVAGLLKHAYPHYSAAQIRERLYRGTDDISYGAHVPTGELGYGRLNAYKALTWYGNIGYPQHQGTSIGSSVTTTWQGEVWISGDIHVPADHTLTIEPGTIVHIAQDDISNSGDHPTMVEWFIEGTVNWGQPGEAPVVFEAFTDVGDSLWVSPAWASTATVNIANVVYEDVAFAETTTTPNGTETFIAGQYIPVEWSTGGLVPANSPGTGPYARAEFVDIELSLDGGTQFSVAASDADATAGTHRVATPFGASTTNAIVRVRFKDKAGVELNVSDSAPFAIQLLEMAGTGSATTLSLSEAPYATIYLDADDNATQDLLLSNAGSNVDAVLLDAVPDGDSTVPVYTTPLSDPLPTGVKETRGGHVADYDDDGWLDIILTGEGRSWLLKNDGAGSLSFSDATSSHPALSGADDQSWAAAFCDFDRDGDLDLYVGRGQGVEDTVGDGLADILLEQNDVGQFVDVTADRGMSAAPDIASTVVAWADHDGDHDLDLFVGHGGGAESSGSIWESRIYQQYHDSSDERAEFSLVTPWGSTTSLASRRVTGAAWADVDQDGYLDLVVSSENATDSHPSQIYWGNSSGGFDAPAVIPDARSVSIADLDLDGRPELLLTSIPGTGNPAPAVLRADDPAQPRVLSDVTATFNLGGAAVGTSGDYRSMVVADVGGKFAKGDGDFDILLGRITGQGDEVFIENPIADNPESSPDWVRVVLKGLEGTANAGPDNAGTMPGATVTVTTNPNTPEESSQTRVIGFDTSGAPNDALLFGLGNDAPDAEFKVVWPDSYVQTGPIPLTAVGDSLIVEDDHEPATIGVTSHLQLRGKPGAVNDWEFTWQTDHSSDPSLDLVRIKQETNSKYCSVAIPLTTITPATPNTSHEVKAIGDGRYLHKLTWYDRPCDPGCTIQYQVQSGTSVQNNASGWKSLFVSVCIY